MPKDKREIVTKDMVSKQFCGELFHLIKDIVIPLLAAALFVLAFSPAFSFKYALPFIILLAIALAVSIPFLVIYLTDYRHLKKLRFFFVEDTLVNIETKKRRRSFKYGIRSPHARTVIFIHFERYGRLEVLASSHFLADSSCGDAFLLAVRDGRKKKIFACYPAKDYRPDPHAI